VRDSQRPIVVVGSINMDLVSTVPRIPNAGETIFALDFQMHPGGKGANQAVGVARLEYPAVMIGMVGRDAFGNQLEEQLKKEGVDTSHVGEGAAATGSASILVDAAGENSIVVASGANLHLTPDVLRAKVDMIREAGLVLTQLEIPLETVQCLAEMCAELHVPLILDPAPAQTLPDGMLRHVTWFTPNETEAQFYAGAASQDDEMLAKLFHAGAQGVILKRGALGSVLAEKGHLPHVIPAPVVAAVDTTAAGDAFNAAFAVGLMNGYGAMDSARFATTAAAISVTRAGAQPSLATRSEMVSVLQAGTATWRLP
jgi:ribokinase